MRPIEWAIALWLAIIYASRLAFDIYLFRYPEQQGSWKAGVNGALSPESLVALAVVTPLLLLALSLRQEGLERLNAALRRIVDFLVGLLTDWRSYVFTLALSAFITALAALGTKQGVLDMMDTWWKEAASGLTGMAPVLAVCAVAYGLWYIVYLLGRGARGDPTISQAIALWSSCGFFVATTQVVALLLWVYGVYPELLTYPRLTERGHSLLFVGYLKDTTIYAIIAFFVGSGLVKFESCLPVMESSSAWRSIRSISISALVAAVVALAADVSFAEKVALRPSETGFDAYWPDAWQRDAVHVAVYVRDFGLLVPGVIFMFVWVWREVARATEQRRATPLK